MTVRYTRRIAIKYHLRAAVNQPIMVTAVALLLWTSIWSTSAHAIPRSAAVGDSGIVPPASDLSDEVIACSTASCLHSALKNVLPGKRIVLAPGTYTGSFSTDVEGTAQQPIVIESQQSDNPAVISGYSVGSGYGLRVRGDHWVIRYSGIPFEHGFPAHRRFAARSSSCLSGASTESTAYYPLWTSRQAPSISDGSNLPQSCRDGKGIDPGGR